MLKDVRHAADTAFIWNELEEAWSKNIKDIARTIYSSRNSYTEAAATERAPFSDAHTGLRYSCQYRHEN